MFDKTLITALQGSFFHVSDSSIVTIPHVSLSGRQLDKKVADSFDFHLYRETTTITYNCRFLVPDNTQKILMEIWHPFWLKNDGEKWSRKNDFEIPRAP